MGNFDFGDKPVNTKEKSKYWVAVGYLENMLPDWKQQIGDLLQGLPYSYCVHDKDLDLDGDCRKEHVHIILVFNNTTTYKHALYSFRQLNAPGHEAFNTCQPILSIRGMYDYIIHNTETAKKAGKHQYDPSERISGNNFDIGSFEQLSQLEKDEMALELCDIIIKEGYTNFTQFFMYVRSNFGMEYFSILKSHSGLFERITKGNYQIAQVKKNEDFIREAALMKEKDKVNENVRVSKKSKKAEG